MIEIVNISKSFQPNFWEKKIDALSDVSFKINEGDLVGFLGANGAGKTTLIKCLMDFSLQTSGDILFDESLGKTKEEIKKQIGYLPEKAYLYPYLTAREFLHYVGSLYHIEKKELIKAIDYWADKLQMTFALDRMIKTYSKGMQQRVGFISAVINNPKFLVLDEPLSGLDPIGRRDFKEIFKELHEKGTTIFFSSHIVSDVEELCNKVVFLEKGKLIYNGSVAELIHQNANDYYDIQILDGVETISLNVDETQKDQMILNLLNDKKNIVKIDKKSKTLEEIIYKIKK